jgi:hypothetical protein
MSCEIQLENHPVAVNLFNPELKQIYIRIDSKNEKFFIIFVPPGSKPLHFPPNAIVITVHSLKTHHCEKILEQGDCVKITPVSSINLIVHIG